MGSWRPETVPLCTEKCRLLREYQQVTAVLNYIYKKGKLRSNYLKRDAR